MATDPLATIDSAVESLASSDVSCLDGSQLLGLVAGVERLRRRTEAVGTRLVAEVESRRLAGEYARSTTSDLLVTVLRISPADARSRVEHALATGPRTTLTGEPLPPMLPALGRAAADGDLCGAHIDVVIDCLDHVPSTLSPDACSVVESALVDAARHEHPQALRRTARMLLARLDPDGIEPREDHAERDRDLTLIRFSDGSSKLRGRLSSEATVVWGTVLDALSAPAPAHDGLRDDRTAGQRRHDGLLDAGHRLLRSGSLPVAGGVPVTVLIRTSTEDLANGAGVATSDRGDVLDLRRLRYALGDAELVPVRVTRSGGVLDLGRSRRLANRSQRLALSARDGGCCFPDCDRPASWTEVHHVIPWQEGGSTDIDNLCLVCRFHHREFERCGWQVQIVDGVPEWIPPPFLDPARRPQRNRAHHPPDLNLSPELLPERFRTRAAGTRVA